MNGFHEPVSRFLFHFFLGVLTNFCFVALFTGLIGCAEHSAFLGGQDVDSVTLDQTPPVAISEFRRAHPNGQIENIKRVVSNGPVSYRISYRENNSRRWEFRYSNSMLDADFPVYPNAVEDAFKRIHPGVKVERVDWIYDDANGVEFFRVGFHVATDPLEHVSFDRKGKVFQERG